MADIEFIRCSGTNEDLILLEQRWLDIRKKVRAVR